MVEFQKLLVLFLEKNQGEYRPVKSVVNQLPLLGSADLDRVRVNEDACF